MELLYMRYINVYYHYYYYYYYYYYNYYYYDHHHELMSRVWPVNSYF